MRRLPLLTEKPVQAWRGRVLKLAVIAGLCQNYGALLLVDEAHAPWGARDPVGAAGHGPWRGSSLFSGTFAKAFEVAALFPAGDGPDRWSGLLPDLGALP